MDLYKAFRFVLYASKVIEILEVLVEVRIVYIKSRIYSLFIVLEYRAPEIFRRIYWLGLGNRVVALGAGTGVRARCFWGVRC
jgi:hypothetical protein